MLSRQGVKIDKVPFALALFNLNCAINFKRTDSTPNKLLSFVDDSQSIEDHIADGNTTVDGTVIPKANVIQADSKGNIFLQCMAHPFFESFDDNSIIIEVPQGTDFRRLVPIESMHHIDVAIKKGTWAQSSNNPSHVQETLSGEVHIYSRPIFARIEASFGVFKENDRFIHDFLYTDPRRIAYFEEFNDLDKPPSKLMYGLVTIGTITATSLNDSEYDTSFAFAEKNIGS